MQIIKQLITYYWGICLLKRSPENTPYSPALCVISSLLLTLIMTVQWQFSDFDFSKDLLLCYIASITLVVSFLIYTAIVLFLRGLQQRIIQTVTSLLITQLIIHSCALPLFFLDPYLTPSSIQNPFVLLISLSYLFITVTLSIWQFVVTAYIYKLSLDTTPLQSVLVAFGLIAVNVLTLSFWR